MAEKEELHRLVDELPAALTGELLDFARALRQKEARRVLEAALGALLSVPDDGEPETSEEAAAVATAMEELGPKLSAADARRSLLG